MSHQPTFLQLLSGRCIPAALLALMIGPASAQMGSSQNVLAAETTLAQAKKEPQDQDMVFTLEKLLSLTDAQKANVDPIIRKHQDQIASVKADLSLTAEKRKISIQANLSDMVNEIKPFLKADQVDRLDRWLAQTEAEIGPKKNKPFIPLISVTYGEYLPTDSLSREIFGSSTSYFGIGFYEFEGNPPKNNDIRFSLDTIGVGSVDNKFFVASPQVTYEHRIPITKGFAAYSKISAGPAYMDYSFDLPSGQHYGAKRIGAEGELELGLRFGRFQFSAQYHALTEPQDVSFNGIELSLTWIAVRF